MELDISGSFIYNGMKELEMIDCFFGNSREFIFLYNIAVGVERIQKIILVLCADIDIKDMKKIEEFEKSLITHNHASLHDQIRNICNIKFNPREINFLHLLSEFYKKSRYNRFNLYGEYDKEKLLLGKFIERNINSLDLERHFLTKEIVNTEKVKDLFGKVIGNISRKYYKLLMDEAEKRNLYTYELRSGSPAQKVFLPEFRKCSLQELNFNEKIAFKEIIIFISNTKKKNSFFKLFKDIEPLNFDIALINNYLEVLSKGIVPQDLIDEVESLYEELPDVSKRLELISIIGNSMIMFDFFDLEKLFAMLNALVNEEVDCLEFSKIFIDDFDSYMDEEYYDEDINGILKVIYGLCSDFIEKRNINDGEKIEFIESIKPMLEKLFRYIHC